MKNDMVSATKSRIKSEMVILRESFQGLNDSISAMLAVMPDAEREILQNWWKGTEENFEELFNHYLQ